MRARIALLALSACAPKGVLPKRSLVQKCHVEPGGASEGNMFRAPRDGPAANATARERCVTRVMAMPATMCKVDATVRELCAHSYVFVGGIFHSGTGALRHALGEVAPTRVSVHADTHHIEDEGKYMQTVYVVNRNRDARLWHCAFIESRRDDAQHPPHTPGSLWRDESDALGAEPRGSTLLFAQWARFWDLRKPILVEKSPMNMLRVRFLDALFPEMASFAVIVRHPFGSCSMALKLAFKALVDAPLAPAPGAARDARAAEATQWPSGARGRARISTRHIFLRLDSIISAWAAMYARYETDARRVARATIVRFEPMLADPREAARRTLRALGLAEPLPPQRRALNYDRWSAGIDARHAYVWRWQYADRFAQLQWLSRPENGGEMEWEALVQKYEPRMRWYGYSLRNLSSLEPPLSPLVCV